MNIVDTRHNCTTTTLQERQIKEIIERVTRLEMALESNAKTECKQREWVGLTHDELNTIYTEATSQTLRPQDERLAFEFAQGVAARLKERNYDKENT